MRSNFPASAGSDRDTYLKVQAILYPGFTIAAPSTAVHHAAFALLLFSVRHDFVLAGRRGLASLALAHAIYWVVTHPVNKVWVKDESSAKSVAPSSPPAHDRHGDWTDCATAGMVPCRARSPGRSQPGCPRRRRHDQAGREHRQRRPVALGR